MDTHRVDIFYRADDDAVVGGVAHHLHLIFFPAEHRFFDQHFGGRREVEAIGDDLAELLHIEGDAAAGAGQGKGGADDGRQADKGLRVQCFFHRMNSARFRRFQAQLVHGVTELLAVFGLVDDLGLGANHFDIILFQNTRGIERQGGVKGRLTAHGREQRIGALPGDDLLNEFRRDRLDIGGVGHVRIGHDGGRIGIDQDDAIAFLTQRLAGLNAGIIELTGLADHNRACADNENGLDICAFGHLGLSNSAHQRRKQKAGCEAQSLGGKRAVIRLAHVLWLSGCFRALAPATQPDSRTNL